MRRSILLVLSASSIIALQAQTLDVGNAPTIGSTWTYISCGPVTLDGTGVDQIWDASGATSTGADETLQCIAPENSSAGSDFPDADAALYYAQTVTYLQVEEDGMYVLGSYLPNFPITSIYTDPAKQFVFPADLGDSWTDDYAGSYTYNGDEVQQSGQMSSTVSGLGDLVLPWGTVENVLRMEVTDTYTEEGLGVTFIMNRTLTEFYRPGLGSYLARKYANTTELNGTPGTPANGFLYLSEDAFSGMADGEQQSIGMEVFPNPAADRATVVLAADNATTLTLFDAHGKMVMQQPPIAAHGLVTATLDLSGLAPGVYSVRAQSQNGDSGSTRLVVTR